MEKTHGNISRDLTFRADAASPEPVCLWARARVVRRKKCGLQYACASCRFDKALRRIASENREKREIGIRPAGKRGRIVHWEEKFERLLPWQRPCIHYLKGRIAFKACLQSYFCNSCEFDQYFLDQLTVYAPVRPVAAAEVEGIRVPHGFYFHPGHTWLKVEEGSRVRVGLDDFARRLVGPLDSVSAPLLGKGVEAGAPAIRIRRKGRTARLPAPAGGIVTAVNLPLSERGGTVSEDPYGEGWVLQLHAGSLPCDLKRLMIGGEAREFMAGEVGRLYRELEDALGPLAIDGGGPGDDICGNLPEESWDRLTRIFFRA